MGGGIVGPVRLTNRNRAMFASLRIVDLRELSEMV
jgi:hypothetical protein